METLRPTEEAQDGKSGEPDVIDRFMTAQSEAERKPLSNGNIELGEDPGEEELWAAGGVKHPKLYKKGGVPKTNKDLDLAPDEERKAA